MLKDISDFFVILPSAFYLLLIIGNLIIFSSDSINIPLYTFIATAVVMSGLCAIIYYALKTPIKISTQFWSNNNTQAITINKYIKIWCYFTILSLSLSYITRYIESFSYKVIYESTGHIVFFAISELLYRLSIPTIITFIMYLSEKKAHILILASIKKHIYLNMFSQDKSNITINYHQINNIQDGAISIGGNAENSAEVNNEFSIKQTQKIKHALNELYQELSNLTPVLFKKELLF